MEAQKWWEVAHRYFPAGYGALFSKERQIMIAYRELPKTLHYLSDDAEILTHYLESFPPGHSFRPEDSELILHYLLPIINGNPLHPNNMHRVNIYDHTPDYLTANYDKQGKNTWYFITSREKMYPKGLRPDRKAGDGYWKPIMSEKVITEPTEVKKTIKDPATGADKVIKETVEKPIGFRKKLVYYNGKPSKGIKTSWRMDEYRVDKVSSQNTQGKDTSMRLDDNVLCRIYRRVKNSGSNDENGGKKRSKTADPRVGELADRKGKKQRGSREKQVLANVQDQKHTSNHSHLDNDANNIDGNSTMMETNSEA